MSGEDENISEFLAEVRSHQPGLADDLELFYSVEHLGNVVGATCLYGDMNHVQLHLKLLNNITQQVFGPDTMFAIIEAPPKPDRDEIDADDDSDPELEDDPDNSDAAPEIAQAPLEEPMAQTENISNHWDTQSEDTDNAERGGNPETTALGSNRAERRRQAKAEKRSRFDSERIWQELHSNPTRAFETVLGRSLITKAGRKEPLALCPWHDDRNNPNLSINLEKLVCHCHNCKNGGGIADLAKQVWGLDYAGVMRRFEKAFLNGNQNGIKPRFDRKIINTIRYEIRDLEGELKATHIRHEFDNGDKSMPWEPAGIKTSELPLFQIEKTVDSADGDPVIVCEGEKAALKLWEKDQMLAVGTVTGAGHIPCDESLKALLRFTVYLWPDNDTGGYEHMRQIGERLLVLGHTEVWMIKWPEAPEKGDAADFSGDVGALLGAAERFVSLPATTNGNNHLPALTGEINREPIDAFDAYQEMSAEPREYSWENLLRICCTMVLTALMGAGKTTLAMNVVRGWALAESVLGGLCKASKTLVVVSSKEWEAWVDTIGFWGIKGKIFLIPSLNTQFPKGIDQAHWFQEIMQKYGCSTFVLDTMFDFFGIPPSNTGDSNRMAMAEQAPLLEAVRLNHWSGIVTGHPPKSEAQAIVNRDPEESFGGHTAWSAQHRMRAVIRRKSQGVSTFLTGRGGLGDKGILKEGVLLFDEKTRLVRLDGPFADHLGEIARSSIVEAVQDAHCWVGRSALVKATGKGEAWVKAGVKAGLKSREIKWN